VSEISSNFDAARERLKAQAETTRPTLLTVLEVAEFARCEHKTVRNAIHAGLLPACTSPPSRRLLIDEVDAIAWVKSHPVRAGEPPAPRPAKRARSKRNGAALGSVQALREIQRNLT
jgi:hypothetical protein